MAEDWGYHWLTAATKGLHHDIYWYNQLSIPKTKLKVKLILGYI